MSSGRINWPATRSSCTCCRLRTCCYYGIQQSQEISCCFGLVSKRRLQGNLVTKTIRRVVYLTRTQAQSWAYQLSGSDIVLSTRQDTLGLAVYSGIVEAPARAKQRGERTIDSLPHSHWGPKLATGREVSWWMWCRPWLPGEQAWLVGILQLRGQGYGTQRKRWYSCKTWSACRERSLQVTRNKLSTGTCGAWCTMVATAQGSSTHTYGPRDLTPSMGSDPWWITLSRESGTAVVRRGLERHCLYSPRGRTRMSVRVV